jgi:putative ABC transport system substrate-binding protein
MELDGLNSMEDFRMGEVVPDHRVRDTGRRRLLGRQRLRGLALIALLASSGLLSGAVSAADRDRPLQIGALTVAWGPNPQVIGLRDGLLALGYREDKDFVIGVRFTQGDVPALLAAARELVQLEADLILTEDANGTKAAQMATRRIPIVFAGWTDPLGAGLIQSFSRPGGNITGVTNLSLELGPKRLQVFQEIIPGLKRVLFPYDAANADAVTEARGYRDAARRLGIELVERAVRTEAEARTALAMV